MACPGFWQQDFFLPADTRLSLLRGSVSFCMSKSIFNFTFILKRYILWTWGSRLTGLPSSSWKVILSCLLACTVPGNLPASRAPTPEPPEPLLSGPRPPPHTVLGQRREEGTWGEPYNMTYHPNTTGDPKFWQLGWGAVGSVPEQVAVLGFRGSHCYAVRVTRPVMVACSSKIQSSPTHPPRPGGQPAISCICQDRLSSGASSLHPAF